MGVGSSNGDLPYTVQCQVNLVLQVHSVTRWTEADCVIGWSTERGGEI